MSGVGKSAIKMINVPKDMMSEVQNHIVSTNKIMPENLYNLSLGHSIAVGVALDPGSHFPESMGKKEIDSLFKIVGEFMESEKMPEESIKSFMLHLTKRMKALSEKVEDAKKRKQKKPVRPVSFHEVERHPRVWRRHWRENEQHERVQRADPPHDRSNQYSHDRVQPRVEIDA